jgi:small conductance mechanosensitive channel
MQIEEVIPAEQLDLLLLSLKTYGLRVVLAIVFLVAGLKIISWIHGSLARRLSRSRVDPSLASFLKSLLGAFLKAALFISIFGMLGIETTSLVAVLASAGLAIGLALQGTLSNVAGGALILLSRPFRVGDFISAQGFDGTVKEIQIICTILTTPDNKQIILPNGPLAGGNIVNFSAEPIRRCDMTFGVSYGDDLKLVKSTLQDLVAQDIRALKDPKPNVVVAKLNDSSVDFSVRVFVNAPDFWPFFFDMQERVKLCFDEKGISIPFPQRDVHLHNKS